jgi:hypothetical protein
MKKPRVERRLRHILRRQCRVDHDNDEEKNADQRNVVKKRSAKTGDARVEKDRYGSVTSPRHLITYHHTAITPTFDNITGTSIASIQRRSAFFVTFIYPLRGCSESLTTQQQYAAERREDLEAVVRRGYWVFCALNGRQLHHQLMAWSLACSTLRSSLSLCWRWQLS